MKLILASVFLLFAFSCSKENTEPKIDELNPVGIWSLFKIKLKYSAFGPLVQDTSIVPCLKGSKMVLEENGTWKSKYVSDSVCVIYYSLSSSISWQPTTPQVSGTWSKNGNTFTMERTDRPGEKWDYLLSKSGGRLLFNFSDTTESLLEEVWYIKD